MELQTRSTLIQALNSYIYWRSSFLSIDRGKSGHFFVLWATYFPPHPLDCLVLTLLIFLLLVTFLLVTVNIKDILKDI